jgi:hypothetical protein
MFGYKKGFKEFYTTGIDNSVCVSPGQNLSDMTLQGDYFARMFTFFQLDFERCTNTSKPDSPVCKSLEDIEQWMSTNKVTLAFIN